MSIVDNVKNLDDADETIRDENVAFYLDKLQQLHVKFTAGDCLGEG